MEIIETGHAVMTAYEVLQVVKKRQVSCRPYKEARDQELLGDFQRISQARDLMIPSLMAHSPEGTDEKGKDKIADAIREFCAELQDLAPSLTLFQLRNILAVRPRNVSELACIFPSTEEWSAVAAVSDDIVNLVGSHFPLPTE